MKQSAPAAVRNTEPILSVLRAVLPPRGRVLEIASGTGQHAAAFARAMPALEWQPTDADPRALESIHAWRAESGLPNLLPAIVLDVTQPRWPIETADAMVCINMVHISPWESSLALFAGASRVLPSQGVLVTYGPYRFDGVYTAPSNESFDASLRARDPRWGVRDVRDLEQAARTNGIQLEQTVSLPANNHALVWRKLEP